jgi:hypothetical protein
MGRLREAERECEFAASCFRTLGDRRGECWALFVLGSLYRQQSRFLLAWEVQRRSLTMAEGVRDPGLNAYVRAGIAETERLVGDYARSFQGHMYVYALFRSLDDRRGEVWALEGVGQMLKNVGRTALASGTSIVRNVGPWHVVTGEAWRTRSNVEVNAWHCWTIPWLPWTNAASHWNSLRRWGSKPAWPIP